MSPETDITNINSNMKNRIIIDKSHPLKSEKKMTISSIVSFILFIITLCIIHEFADLSRAILHKVSAY